MMVDQYWREIEDVENNIENTIQISAILLKHQVHDKKLEELSKIDTNENNISSNLEKINDNTAHITNNLKKLDNVTQFISKSEKYFEKKYAIQKKIFNFNKENNFLLSLNKKLNMIL